MEAVSLTQQQNQLLIDRISRLDATIGDLADSCRGSAGTDPGGRSRDPAAAGKSDESFSKLFRKPVTEGDALKALTKYTGNHSGYHLGENDYRCDVVQIYFFELI